MKRKTTQEIIEEIGISLTNHNTDKIRDFTEEWIKVTDLVNFLCEKLDYDIKTDSFHNLDTKFIKELIFINPTPSIDGEKVNKTGGLPNEM